MAVTAWRAPLAASNETFAGNVDWFIASATTLRTVGDGDRATSSPSSGQSSRVLRGRSFGFTSADIPQGATILGIEVGINRGATVSSSRIPRDAQVQLIKSGVGQAAQVGVNKANTSLAWSSTDFETIFGGPTDNWGASLTQADVVTSTFGVDYRGMAAGTSSSGLRVDAFRVRIYYEVGGVQDTTPPTITSPANHSVNENTAYNATATANEAVTWAKGGADASRISLNTATGAWTLTAQDYESKPVVTFTLTGTDAAGLSTTQTNTVNINDLDEIAPTITSAATGSVQQGTAFNVSLTANEAVTWNKISGTAALSGSTLTYPTTLAVGTYETVFRATDAAGNPTQQTHTLTVTAAPVQGGGPWTPADLAIQPRLWARHRTATWSGNFMFDMPNSGSEGGVASVGAVTKQEVRGGYPTFTAAGGAPLTFNMGAVESGVVTMFAVYWTEGGHSQCILGTPQSWGPVSGYGVYVVHDSRGFLATGAGYSNLFNHPLENDGPAIHQGSAAGNDPTTQWKSRVVQLGPENRTRRNGAETINAGANKQKVMSAYVPQQWVVGGMGGGELANGTRIAEVMMFDRALTTDEIEKLEGWAAWEYDMVADLPADHLYKTAAPGGSVPTPARRLRRPSQWH